MSLEEEITLVQFAQGRHPVTELLAEYSKLDAAGRGNRLMNLTEFLAQLKPNELDNTQALAESKLDDTYSPRFFSGNKKRTITIYYFRAEEDSEKDYRYLLYLFKVMYQRLIGEKNEEAANWWLWDLSNQAMAETVLTQHQERIDNVYGDLGFQAEFVCMAKLWFDRYTKNKASEATPTYFHFLTYDEILTEYSQSWATISRHPIGLLITAVQNALAKKYRLTALEANRLLMAVLERHFRVKYNTGLFDW